MLLHKRYADKRETWQNGAGRSRKLAGTDYVIEPHKGRFLLWLGARLLKTSKDAFELKRLAEEGWQGPQGEEGWPKPVPTNTEY